MKVLPLGARLSGSILMMYGQVGGVGAVRYAEAGEARWHESDSKVQTDNIL